MDEISVPKELVHSDGVPGAGVEKVTLPSNMVERVADVIAARLQRYPMMIVARFLATGGAIELAQIAIEAMREPTPAMILAGHQDDPLACDVGDDQIEYVYGSMWRAMIEAALRQPDRTVASTDGTSE